MGVVVIIKKDNGSTDRFGNQWVKFNSIMEEHEKQFNKWVYPLEKKEFINKTVLDAGCGTGRNSYWVLKYGAKKVIAFDYDKNTVDVAKSNLQMFSNCEVNYESIYNIPYKEEFDISMAIGVIHHLEYPEEAIQSLIDATKKEGLILVWVYAYEGNEWIVRYVNPIRKITSHLPVSLVSFVSYLMAMPLYFYLHLIKQNKEYFIQLSNFRFWIIHNIILDQLIPKIANYWTKQQALDLFKNKNIKEIKIQKINNNSWTIIGKKCSATN